jgi:REP element-mobilizing transposase RayT
MSTMTTTAVSAPAGIPVKVGTPAPKVYAVRPEIRQFGGTYFYAAAIAAHKNIFVTPEYLDLLANAFKLAELKLDIKNLAYVIMPNHFYWVFRLGPKQDDPLPIYREVKRTVALEILNNLKYEAKEENTLFQPLDLFVGNDRVKRSNPRKILWAFKEEAKKLEGGGKFKVWDNKSRLFLMKDAEQLLKNVKYLVDAPIRERWNLVSDSFAYPYLYISDELMDKVKVKA